MCGSLAQLLFYRDDIIRLLVEHMEMVESEPAAAPLSALTATLIRDLGDEVVPFFSQLFAALISILSRTKEVESVEVVLGSLFYFIKSLLADVEPVIVVNQLVTAFKNEKLSPQVQDFLAEFAAFVLQSRHGDEELLKIILRDVGEQQDLCACILAGSLPIGIQKDLGTVACRLSTVSSLIDGHLDAEGLFFDMLKAMVDRHNAEVTCMIIAKLIPMIKSVSVMQIILQSIFKLADFRNGRFITRHTELLEAITTQSLVQDALLQDVIVAIIAISDLLTILPLRNVLKKILSTARGVSLLIQHCHGHLEPLVGTSTAVTILVEQIYPVNSLAGILLLQTLVDKVDRSSTVYLQLATRLPMEQLVQNVKSREFELSWAALKLLSALPNIESLPWMDELALQCPEWLRPEQWIALLNAGRRFISKPEDLVKAVRPWLANIQVLELLDSLPSCIIDPTHLLFLLTSSESHRRLLALNLLSRTTLGSSLLFTTAHKLELVPWTFNCDRDKNIHLQALANQLRAMRPEKSLEIECLVGYLLGVLLKGFHPLRKELYATLGVLFDGHVALTRRIFSEVLRNLSVLEANPTIDEVGKLEISVDDILTGNIPPAVLPNDVPFYTNAVVGPIIGFLASKPVAADILVDTLLPLTLAAFANEEDPPISCHFRKQLQSNLADLLIAIAGWRSIKSNDPRFERVSSLLLKFLTVGESTVQRRALDAIFALKIIETGEISLYMDRLRRLLDEKEMRDELVLLAADKATAETWTGLLPLLIRLLSGMMVSRRGTTAGRNSMETRRKLVLNYIATWDEVSIHAFVLFMGEMAGLPSATGVETKKIVGFLNLLETVISRIGKKLSQATVDVILGWLLIDHHAPENDAKALGRLVTKRIRDVIVTIPETISLDQWNQSMYNLLAPRIARLEFEYMQDSSALLEILHFWISTPKFQPVALGVAVEMWPRLAASLGATNAKDAVLLKFLDVWTVLIGLVRAGSLEARSVLLTELTALTTALNRRIAIMLEAGRTGIILDRVVIILLELASFIIDLQDKASLVESLVRLLPLKGIREESKTRMLNLTSALYIPVLHEQVLKVASVLLSQLRDREARAALARLFSQLATHDESLLLFSSVLSDLHAPSIERIGEYDYELQTRGFSILRGATLTARQWPPVLQSMFYFCHDEEDSAARTHAFSIIIRFIKSVESGCLNEEGMQVLMNVLYPALKKGLRSKAESIRHEFLGLLSILISAFQSIEPFSTLTPLLAGGNEEANVLLNLLHLQMHRRTRALARLLEFATLSSLSVLSKSTIEDIFIPLLEHFVMSDPTSRDPVPPMIVHEAIMAMAAFLSRLPAKNVIKRTMKLASLVRRGVPYEKALLKLIPAVYRNMPSDALDKQQITLNIGTLFELLVGTGKQADSARPGIAVAIAELLPRLGPDSVGGHVPKLIANLTAMLLHKHSDKRKEARDTLASVLGSLGVDSHLPFVLKELRVNLTGGWRPHILAYSVNHLLVKVKIQPGVLDCCLPELIPIVVGDMFGERAVEKTTNEWTGKLMEVRIAKSHETLAIMVGNVSSERIMQILVAIRNAAAATNRCEWVETACKAIEDGLSRRTDDISSLLFALLSADGQFYNWTASGSYWSLHSIRFQLVASRVLLTMIKQGHVPVGTLNQFVPLISGHVLTSQSTPLMAAGIKTFAAMMRQPLSSLTEPLLQSLLQRLFELVVKTDAARQTELVNAAFKLISSLVRERDDVQLTEGQLRALLVYIRANIDSTSADPSGGGGVSIAYTLIRAILRRQVILVEVYELMSVISRTMLRAFHATIRQQCRAVYLSFLLDYPLARPKLEEHFSFLTANLGYEVDGGRESIALFLSALVEKLPSELLQEIGETWFVALAARLVNEPSKTVLVAVKSAIKSVVARLDVRSMDRIELVMTKWLRHPSEVVNRTAWTAAPLILYSTTVATKNLTNLLLETLKVEEVVKIQEITLETLMAVMEISPNAIAAEKVISLMNYKVEERKMLVLRDQLIGEYFAQIGDGLAGIRGHTVTISVFAEWPRLWLRTLQSLTGEEDISASEQIVKNMLFVARQLEATPLTEGKIRTIEELAGKTEKVFRSIPTGTAPLFASALLKFYAALLVSCAVISDGLARSIISACTRVLEEGRSDNSVVAQQVMDMLATQLGDRFEGLRAEVLRNVSVTRRKRRDEAARLAIIDPQAFSKRRMQRTQRRHDAKKAKR